MKKLANQLFLQHIYEDNDRAEKIVKSQRLLGGCCVINYIIDLVQLIIKLRQVNITPTDFFGFSTMPVNSYLSIEIVSHYLRTIILYSSPKTKETIQPYNKIYLPFPFYQEHRCVPY
jgi:hypothetical protein